MAGARPLSSTTAEVTPVSRGRAVPEAPVVSVCIPVVSEHGLIERCLESVAAAPASVDTEVVVVANGLGPDGLSPLRARDDIVLVQSAVNAGFSGGNNLAAGLARGRYLLLLNDDSAVEAGYIDRLLAAFERDRSIGAAGGTIFSADGTLQEAGSVLWSDGWATHVGIGRSGASTAYAYVRDTDYISANGLLVARDAWDAVGGLDERYFPAYYEDVDLCLALRMHGYRVVYEPRARLMHLESRSTSSSFRNFLLVRNRATLGSKWSVALQDFMDRPDPTDDAAIDAAVLRAQHSRGRLLVVEDSADAREWPVALLEALSAAGWSVMFTVLGGTRGPQNLDEGLRDRLMDLGVDVRDGRPQDLVSTYGQTLEAVVCDDEFSPVPGLRRPDGGELPLVRRDQDGIDAVLDGVATVARPPRPVRPVPPPVDDPSGHAPNGAARAIEGPDAVRARRDLDFARADANVRREYAESLEREVAHLRAVAADTDAAFVRLETAFNDREKYIDSLPSVRLKKWVSERLSTRRS